VNKLVIPILTLLVSAPLLLPQAALAQDSGDVRYITDRLYVPLRSGKSQNHRILHKGLPSGTEVSVIESDAEAGYSLIRTRRGLEGWIITRYLVQEPVAEIKLAEVSQKLETLENDNRNLKRAFTNAAGSSKEASQVVTELESENSRLAKQLEEITRISANAIKLDRDYQVLSEAKQMLKDKVDVLETENSRLRDNHENEAFLNGSFAVILGIFAAIVIPRLRPRKRSEWI
jgi:SH3 domain protein